MTTQPIESDEVAPIATVDLKGRNYAELLMGVARRLGEIPPGAVLRVVTDCTSATDDLTVWARHTGREILRTEQDGEQREMDLRNGDPWRASRTLDTRGAHCPVPVVEARRALAQMPPGAVLKLVSDCPAAPREVRTWAATAGYEVLGITRGTAGAFACFVCREA